MHCLIGRAAFVVQATRPQRVIGVGIGMMAVTVAAAVLVIMAMIRAGADALDMMVVALLDQPDLVLEAQRLVAVFAQQAIHGVVAVQNFLDALGEGVEHQRVVVEIGRLDELDLGMAFGDQVRVRGALWFTCGK